MNGLEKRRQSLSEALNESGLHAAAIVPGANFTYLTGLHFHLMERPTLVVFTKLGEVFAVMPELERLKWSSAFATAKTFYWQDSEGFQSAFADLADALGDVSIGIEGMLMRAFEFDALRKNFGEDAITDAEQMFQLLRQSKGPSEIRAIEEAIRISENALAETIDATKIGMRECDILSRLKIRLLENGADGFAFDPIVLIGANSANPHGISGETILTPGDPLLIDFGALKFGYNADITRTFFCQHVSDEHAEIYQTVLAANRKGREIACAQLSAHDLDVAVTEVLEMSPFKELIVHKTGHGLGLAVHESPQIMVGNHVPLVPGTLLTIEPGLYRENDLGVRIEDDVLIEKSGCRSLTRYDRAIQLIGA